MKGARVAVAGCGPCGLATALLLRRRGHDVTLFERFNKAVPIGSGLMIQPTGLAVLHQLKLAERILAEGARIDRLYGEAGDRIVLDVRYHALGRSGLFGVGIHRASLFDALFDQVEAADIPLRTGKTIGGSELDGDRRRLNFLDGSKSEAFDLVVDALGARSPLPPDRGRELCYGALWSTLDWPDAAEFDPAALQQRYRKASVMVGVLPIGKSGNGKSRAAFFWSLRADRLESWRRTGLDAWKSEVNALWPSCESLLDQILDPNQLTFARYCHRTTRRPAQPALIHIGDAWHSASPQLGQGANMALLDAWALAQGLEAANHVQDALGKTIEMRRRHVLLYQWLTALFTPVYQSESLALPFIRDRVVGPLSKLWPATWVQAAMVSGLIGNPLRPLDLTTQEFDRFAACGHAGP